MTRLGVPFGPMLLDRLLEEVRHLPEVIKERELSTARRLVHRVLTMFESHYQGLNHMALSGGWALASPTPSVMRPRKTVPPSPATWPTPP
jgi:hypothetical protein